MINFGAVPANSVLPIFFDSYAGSTGASITISGLAVTDIEIYKGTSMTQRSSDAGYTLLDTDGIDLDGITGIHGFSIDLSDNTDASFYAAGSFYTVVVSAITVDTQTVNFVAATFRIVAAENTAGTPVADTVRVAGTAQTARDIGASVLLSNGTGTGQISLSSGLVTLAGVTHTGAVIPTVTTTTTATNLTNAPTSGDFTATMKTSIGTAVAASAVASVTGNVGGNVTGSVGSVVGAVGSVTGNVGGNVVGSVASVSGAVGSVTGLTASDVAAIKTQTDKFVFTVANQVNANVQYVNDVLVNGTGAVGDEWGP